VPGVLQVTCKGCYSAFPVPDQLTEDEFAAADIPTRSLPCPHCRIRRPYDKADYFFGSQDEDLRPPWELSP
jgi:hypothetical protein